MTYSGSYPAYLGIARCWWPSLKVLLATSKFPVVCGLYVCISGQKAISRWYWPSSSQPNVDLFLTSYEWTIVGGLVWGLSQPVRNFQLPVAQSLVIPCWLGIARFLQPILVFFLASYELTNVCGLVLIYSVPASNCQVLVAQSGTPPSHIGIATLVLVAYCESLPGHIGTVI